MSLEKTYFWDLIFTRFSYWGGAKGEEGIKVRMFKLKKLFRWWIEHLWTSSFFKVQSNESNTWKLKLIILLVLAYTHPGLPSSCEISEVLSPSLRSGLTGLECDTDTELRIVFRSYLTIRDDDTFSWGEKTGKLSYNRQYDSYLKYYQDG